MTASSLRSTISVNMRPGTLKAEAGAFNDEVEVADLLSEYEAKIAAPGLHSRKRCLRYEKLG